MKPLTRSIFAVLWGCAPMALPLALSAQPRPGDRYQVSGPHTYQNLSVFLIHGQGRSAHNLITLQEALDQHKVVVYETRSVNELAIENVSDDDVFIHSGDIVKGGQQDRTLKDDLILPTRSGKVGISSFCIEHGRWTRRGQEPAATFGSASEMVATKELKMAVRVDSNQAEVWDKVSQAQKQLAGSTNETVVAEASPTSFAMTMQTSAVLTSTDGYIRTLSPIIENNYDVIGYAFAINGKLNSIEMYASHELFAKLWPKLLKASAVEAVAAYQPKAKFTRASAEPVKYALRDKESGPVSERELNSRTKVVMKDTSNAVRIETQDRRSDTWVHRTYLSKE